MTWNGQIARTGKLKRNVIFAEHIFVCSQAWLTPANRAEYEGGVAALKATMDGKQLAFERLAASWRWSRRVKRCDDALSQPNAARQGATASLTEHDYEVASLVARKN